MRHIGYIILSVALVIVSSCAKKTKRAEIQIRPEIPVDWLLFEAEDFVIRYPPDWEIRENMNGTVVCLLSRPASGGDLFRENVNLVTERLTEDMGIDKYASLSMRKIGNKYEIKEQKKYVAGGQESYHVRFAGADRLQIEQKYFLKGKKAFIVTFTYELQESDKIKDTGDKIINSFGIK
ncbi:MAG: hypothetical protein LBC19_01075 [Tannerella sp.]|jgi:hypothetical protein|nr:hypothetical protein [Tannerella sp.]